jgi:hypothetical protein
MYPDLRTGRGWRRCWIRARGGHRGRRRAGPVGPVAVAAADEGEHRLQCGRAVLLPDALSVNVRSSGTPSSCRSGFWSRLRVVSIAARSPRLI